jgi:hypothetical protein
MGQEKIDITKLEKLNEQLGEKCINILQTNNHKWNWSSDKEMFDDLRKLGTEKAKNISKVLLENTIAISNYYLYLIDND